MRVSVPPHLQPPPPPPLPAADLLDMLRQEVHPFCVDVPQSLVTTIHTRYGIPFAAVRTEPHTEKTIPVAVMKAVFKYDPQWQGEVSEEKWALMGDLFGGHANGKPQVNPQDPAWLAVADRLGKICDIFTQSPLPHPCTHHPPRFRLAILDIPADPRRQTPSHKGYLLIPRSDATQLSWVVLLEDAISVLQAMRQGWGPEMKVLVYQLAMHGIPFRTVRMFKQAPLLVDNRDRLGLQVTPPGYTPTILDYAVYVQRCKDLLLGCQGRIALMKGGILWRLAMEFLGADDRWVLKVITVPGDCRQVVFHTTYKEKHLLDDELTQREEDIICGVYRVLSDPGSSGKRQPACMNFS